MNKERFMSQFYNKLRIGYGFLKKFEKYPGNWKTLDDIFAKGDKTRLERELTCNVDVINEVWYCPYSGKYSNKNVFLDICNYAEISQKEHPITHEYLCACTNFLGKIKTRKIKENKKNYIKTLLENISPKIKLRKKLEWAIRNENYEEAERIQKKLNK